MPGLVEVSTSQSGDLDGFCSARRVRTSLLLVSAAGNDFLGLSQVDIDPFCVGNDSLGLS